jgi:hypothetical protein
LKSTGFQIVPFKEKISSGIISENIKVLAKGLWSPYLCSTETKRGEGEN